VESPAKTVIARPLCCAHCQAALEEADRTLAARSDKVDLPPVRPGVTRVERYAGECRHCGRTRLAPVPEGLEPGTPFSLNVVALAIYRRVVQAAPAAAATATADAAQCVPVRGPPPAAG
jgi:transposase